MNNILLRGILLTLVLATTGCVGVAINGATVAAKATPRAALEEKAEQGDAEAQYELGLSHCCMGVGFSTQTATEWFCKAAAQEHPGAMYELGRIYLGEVSRTPAPFQKVALLATAQRSNAHAWYWLSAAVEAGHERAANKLTDLNEEVSEGDRQMAELMGGEGHELACTYNEVFTNS